jgi:hypothetical protein
MEPQRNADEEQSFDHVEYSALPAMPISQDQVSSMGMSTLERGVVESDEENAKTTPSIATATQHSRKPHGSLRKTAIAKTRECFIITPPTMATTMNNNASTQGFMNEQFESDLFPHNTVPFDQQEQHGPELLTSPTTTSQEEPYILTSDEDDIDSLHLPPVSSSTSSLNPLATESTMSVRRRRSHLAEPRASTAVTSRLTEPDIEDDWDYSETEWWGWVILAATWIVFVVVMGSCLGVWSWAWDVGETPYAPPDLEDDDTLPITGYYPALMVCTAVMAWVWVVVAWVGLKYFRHAKVVADDG